MPSGENLLPEAMAAVFVLRLSAARLVPRATSIGFVETEDGQKLFHPISYLPSLDVFEITQRHVGRQGGF